MADGTENILLNIEFNNDDIQAAVKNISDSRKAIDALIDANKKLVEQGQKNSKSYIQNQEAIKVLNKEVANNSKIVQANTQATEANANSIEALKKQNSDLLKERNKLDTSTEEGRAAIAKLNEQYDKNSEIIKENASLVEKQRFNIGNYTESIIKASEHIEKLKKENQQLTVVLKTVDRATKEGQDQYNQINTAIQNNITQINKYKVVVKQTSSVTDQATAGLKQLAPAQAQAVQGFIGMTRSALAFLATPIGAIIAAIGLAIAGVVAYFKQFEVVLDFIENAVTKVTAVFSSLIQNLDKVASIVGNVLTGNFKKAADQTKSLGTELGRAADEAQRLLDMTRDLEDAELKYRVANAGAANQMKAWVIESKRRDLSIEESNALLQKASDLENELTEVAVKNAQKRADIEQAKLIESRKAQLEAAGIAQKAGESQADFLNRLVDSGIFSPEALDPVLSAYEAVQQAASEGLAFQEKIQNQRIAQEEKADAERQKLAEKRKAENEKLALEEAEAFKNIQDLKFQLLEEGRQKEITALENAAQEQIAAVKGTEEQKAEQVLLINEKLAQDLAAQKEVFAEEDRAREEERVKANQEFLADALAEELQTYEDYVKGLINAKKEELLQGVISQQEYNDEINDLQAAASQVEYDLKQQFGEQDLALQGRITDAKIAQKQFEADETARLEAFKLQAVQSTLGSVASLFNKNSIAFKALASAQALIQTYQSAQAVFTGMTSTISGPIGVALGIAGAIAAVAGGLANVAKINNTKLPKLEQGGLIEIGGRRHSSGGEDVTVGGRKVANVEGGESMVVLKRGSSKLLRNLSNINQMVGGVDFFNNRAPKSYLADGGFVARAASSKVQNLQTISIAEDLKNVKLEVSVTDIEKKQKDIARAKVTSELS
jgi:hypothetical protein